MPETKSVKTPVAAAKKVVAAWVPSAVAECVAEDREAMARGSDSYVIGQILERHYAKRVKAKIAARERKSRIAE